MTGSESIAPRMAEKTSRPQPKLTVAGLTVSYASRGKSVTPFADVNFEVQDGEFICIIGPSGAGKSTLLFALAGLVGSTAVVTGASRGIGESIATALLRAGADVIALQRTPPSTELRHVAREWKRNLEHVPVDFIDQESIAAAIDETVRATQVDILVNNAGTQIRHDSLSFPMLDFDTVMAVNTRSVFQLCTGFAAGMVARRHGKIINLASLLSFQGGLRVPAYAASKGAVAQLTKSFANEWASHGVNVNAIAPGYLSTDMNTALMEDGDRSGQIMARIPAGRWGHPDDIAGVAVFLASSASDYVHGITLPVDGGWLGR